MKKEIYIVTKVQSDYDYYNPTVLFATDNHATAEAYALKGNRVIPMLEQFYLDKVNELTYKLDYETVNKTYKKGFEKVYEIYNSKYERFQRTEFRVDTVPFYLFNKNRYENTKKEKEKS